MFSALFLQITITSIAFTVAIFKWYGKVWKLNAFSNKAYPYFQQNLEADPDIDGTIEAQPFVLLWSDATYVLNVTGVER